MVDDEINILQGYRRQYRNDFDVCVAKGPEEGLKAVTEDGPFAVVVSDFKMPGMNGVEFLMKVRELAPNTIRIMLTGFADTKVARQAMKEGAIFRFLTKPCSPGHMKIALDAGIAQIARLDSLKNLNSA